MYASYVWEETEKLTLDDEFHGFLDRNFFCAAGLLAKYSRHACIFGVNTS